MYWRKVKWMCLLTQMLINGKLLFHVWPTTFPCLSNNIFGNMCGISLTSYSFLVLHYSLLFRQSPTLMKVFCKILVSVVLRTSRYFTSPSFLIQSVVDSLHCCFNIFCISISKLCPLGRCLQHVLRYLTLSSSFS